MVTIFNVNYLSPKKIDVVQDLSNLSKSWCSIMNEEGTHYICHVTITDANLSSF